MSSTVAVIGSSAGSTKVVPGGNRPEAVAVPASKTTASSSGILLQDLSITVLPCCQLRISDSSLWGQLVTQRARDYSSTHVFAESSHEGAMKISQAPLSRRHFIALAGGAVTWIAGNPLLTYAAGSASTRIGIIGSGKVGSAIGGTWVKRGH